MHISGFEKFTLLDYPGKMASVVFTPGCVFRCPYCHNPELVAPKDSAARRLFKESKEEEFWVFLEKRQGKLDGVCITGGEPTLQKDLKIFIQKIKNMGFFVKLDTNGVFPDIVEDILRTELVDYWAMDIKHTPEKYHLAAGKNVPVEDLKKTVQLIMEQASDYEFRTTVVPGIHQEDDFLEIAQWIIGAKAYYLQEYRDVKLLDEALGARAKEHSIDLDKIQSTIQEYFEHMEIRR